MLSKTTEYALRAVTFLAVRQSPDHGPTPAEDVARITRVPRRYLHRVMQGLAEAGLVESRCGSQGGYLLAKPADSITILDVVNAVEPVGRICNCPLGLASHTSLCPLHAELDRAYEATEAAFASVTIAGLVHSANPIIPLFDSP